MSEKGIRKGFVLSRISTSIIERSKYLGPKGIWGSRDKAILFPTATITHMFFAAGYSYTVFPAKQTKETTTYITLTEEE